MKSLKDKRQLTQIQHQNEKYESSKKRENNATYIISARYNVNKNTFTLLWNI